MTLYWLAGFFRADGGPKATFPQLLLATELLACGVRALHTTVDPMLLCAVLPGVLSWLSLLAACTLSSVCAAIFLAYFAELALYDAGAVCAGILRARSGRPLLALAFGAVALDVATGAYSVGLGRGVGAMRVVVLAPALCAGPLLVALACVCVSRQVGKSMLLRCESARGARGERGARRSPVCFAPGHGLLVRRRRQRACVSVLALPATGLARAVLSAHLPTHTAIPAASPRGRNLRSAPPTVALRTNAYLRLALAWKLALLALSPLVLVGLYEPRYRLAALTLALPSAVADVSGDARPQSRGRRARPSALERSDLESDAERLADTQVSHGLGRVGVEEARLRDCPRRVGGRAHRELARPAGARGRAAVRRARPGVRTSCRTFRSGRAERRRAGQRPRRAPDGRQPRLAVAARAAPQLGRASLRAVGRAACCRARVHTMRRRASSIWYLLRVSLASESTPRHTPVPGFTPPGTALVESKT
jgi:hypothetical protein